MTPQIYKKLFDQLERDIRNQVVIDSFKRLNRKQKIMVQLRKHPFEYAALTASLILIASVAFARADESHIACPTAEPCKVLILSPAEENLLTGKNGILDTAAQGRAIDLGGFAVYFKSKIASAPAGEVKKDDSKPGDPAK